jgi:DNA-directed RNA polymerase subunit F
MSDDQNVNNEVVDNLVDKPVEQTQNASQTVDKTEYEAKIQALEAQVAQQRELANSLLTEEVTGREALNRIAKVAGKSDEELRQIIEEAEREKNVQQTEVTQQVERADPEASPKSVEDQVRAIMDEREKELDARIQDSYDTRKQLATQTMDQALEAAVSSSEDIKKWSNMLARSGVGDEEVGVATRRMTDRVEERAQRLLMDKREENSGRFEMKWISSAYAEAATQVGEELRAMVGGAYDKIGAASDVVSQFGQVLEEPDVKLPDFSKGNPREHKDAFNEYIKQKYAKAAAKEQSARSATKT